jgi:hypothetical protein
MTEYSGVEFSPGDVVTVDAGGCVDAGGTWIPYLDPYLEPSTVRHTRDAARKWHGLVWIPGATPGLVRISGVRGEPLTIPATIDPGIRKQLYLRLGYEDDENDYARNAYIGMPPPSCGRVAWVKITVHRSEVQPSPTPLPMDLISTQTDANYFYELPQWAAQLTDPTKLPNPRGVDRPGANWALPIDPTDPALKTTQTPSIDFNDRLLPLICKSGPHINYFPATYTGDIFWEEHEHAFMDDDYNFSLVPTSGGWPVRDGLTEGNEKPGNGAAVRLPGILLEFQAGETLNRIAYSSPESWWAQLAYNELFQTLFGIGGGSGIVAGQPAVATGLLGLDCEHDCQTELHPVWALAVRESVNPASPGEVEKWAIFVRNSGNEGGCSEKSPITLASRRRFEHYIDFLGNKFRLKLPIAASGSIATLSALNGISDYGEFSPNATAVVKGGWVVATFDFGASRPENHPIVYGELQISRSRQVSSP